MIDHSLRWSYRPTFSFNRYPVVCRIVTVRVSVQIIHLALFHRCCVFIAHGTDLHPSLPLLVSLPEELFHDSLRPLSIHGQGLRRIAQVSTVHHVPQNLQNTHTHCCISFIVNTLHRPEFRYARGLFVLRCPYLDKIQSCVSDIRRLSPPPPLLLLLPSVSAQKYCRLYITVSTPC